MSDLFQNQIVGFAHDVPQIMNFTSGANHILNEPKHTPNLS